jgi:hypothetical protein
MTPRKKKTVDADPPFVVADDEVTPTTDVARPAIELGPVLGPCPTCGTEKADNRCGVCGHQEADS